MPSGAIPANDLTDALVELAFTNCTADERASYTPGVETAAAAVVKDGDGDSDGMISHGELEKMIRSAEEEVGDAADSVIATLHSGECVVGRMLEETSAKTSGNGRRLAESHLRVVNVMHELVWMIHNICMCVTCINDPAEWCPDPILESCLENQQFYISASLRMGLIPAALTHSHSPAVSCYTWR